MSQIMLLVQHPPWNGFHVNLKGSHWNYYKYNGYALDSGGHSVLFEGDVMHFYEIRIIIS